MAKIQFFQWKSPMLDWLHKKNHKCDREEKKLTSTFFLIKNPQFGQNLVKPWFLQSHGSKKGIEKGYFGIFEWRVLPDFPFQASCLTSRPVYISYTAVIFFFDFAPNFCAICRAAYSRSFKEKILDIHHRNWIDEDFTAQNFTFFFYIFSSRNGSKCHQHISVIINIRKKWLFSQKVVQFSSRSFLLKKSGQKVNNPI